MRKFLGRVISKTMEYLAILLDLITCCLNLVELVLKIFEYRREQQVNKSMEQEQDIGIVDHFLMEYFTLRLQTYVNYQFTNSSDQGPYPNRHS